MFTMQVVVDAWGHTQIGIQIWHTHSDIHTWFLVNHASSSNA